MGDRLKGKVAAVTGGGRGIGRAHCLALASEGAAVVVNDLGGEVAGAGASQSPAQEVVDEIKKKGGQAVANYASVASMEGGESIIKSALDTFGRFDILVNNAGILRDRMVFNMTEEEWDLVIDVHLKGHFTTTKAASVIFRQQRSGRIINTSSEAGLGNMGQANYSAAKEGIVGLTRTVARDLGRYGVTCNAIRPRAATRMTMSDELREAMERSRASGAAAPPPSMADSPMAGMAELDPALISPLIVWLASDESGNVNGRTFVAGGLQYGRFSEPVVEASLFSPTPWTIDQVFDLMPKTLAAGLVNPAPPKDA